MHQTADILQTILTTKAEEVARRKLNLSITNLEELATQQQSPRGFAAAIQQRVRQQKPAIIAEIKKASPSKGVIRENFQPLTIAQDYALNGATCLSILTDKTYFQGSEANLQMVHQRCPLPILRKDFMIDPYQLYESRALGADAILLIVAALAQSQMLELAQVAQSLKLDILVEVHNADELERALAINTPLMGINNRNLRTFETTLQTSFDLKAIMPADRILVTESGITTREEVNVLINQNIYAFLVGESFMRAESPGQQLRALFF
ncbi:MAG: indole-3-glycerol phosphate synthase [Pseudomonadota bacterium]|jgi:indole-3-glycerol phosphate synthase